MYCFSYACLPCSCALFRYNAVTRDVEKELSPCLRVLGMRFYAYNPRMFPWVAVREGAGLLGVVTTHVSFPG